MKFLLGNDSDWSEIHVNSNEYQLQTRQNGVRMFSCFQFCQLCSCNLFLIAYSKRPGIMSFRSSRASWAREDTVLHSFASSYMDPRGGVSSESGRWFFLRRLECAELRAYCIHSRHHDGGRRVQALVLFAPSRAYRVACVLHSFASPRWWATRSEAGPFCAV